jgi:hypothetical protein
VSPPVTQSVAMMEVPNMPNPQGPHSITLG